MGEKSRERRKERVNEAVLHKDLVLFTVRVKEEGESKSGPGQRAVGVACQGGWVKEKKR